MIRVSCNKTHSKVACNFHSLKKINWNFAPADYIIEPLLLKESKPMSEQIAFPQLTVFELDGKDCKPFLNNQIVSSLTDETIYTAICNPKGRIIFTLIITPTPSGYLIAVNHDLSDNFFHYVSLRKFRMDVNIKKVDSATIVNGFGLHATDSSQLNISREKTDSSIASDEQFWQFIFSLELPWISQQTTEKFIPQHVNMDLKKIIAFDKGCYPGQEIIARLHYIGKVKKRMQLYTFKNKPDAAAGDITLVPETGQKIELCSPVVSTPEGWQAQAIPQTS